MNTRFQQRFHKQGRPGATTAPQRGFTLVELMIVLAVTVVLLTLAVPGLAGFISSSRINGLQSELVSSLMLARSEATKRGVPVGVVAVNPTAAGKGEFDEGWKVWVDSNGDGVADANETVIREYAAPGGGARIGSNGVSQVRFGPNGFVMPAMAVSFSVCGAAAAHGFQVRLEAVGLADVREGVACPP